MSTSTNTFKTSEEYMKNSSKWFTKSAIAMADIYNKQIKQGYDMYTDFFNSNPTKGKNNSNFTSDLFHSNIELLRNNIGNITKLSEKAVSNLVNSNHDGKNKDEEETSIINDIIEGYHLQTKQVAEINKRFFETFGKTFKTTNEDVEKSYANFKNKTDDNFRVAEEVIYNMLKSYSSSVNNSSNNKRELFDNINNQLKLLIQNSLKQWEELTQTVMTENNKMREDNKMKESKLEKEKR